MLITILFFISGFILLLYGANQLINGAAMLGKKYRVSPIVIGMLIIGFGTSMPELIISVIAVIQNHTDISVSNVVGSNIANICIAIGIFPFFLSKPMNRHTINYLIPALLLTSIIFFFVANNMFLHNTDYKVISRTEGIIFIFLFSLVVYYMLFIYKESLESNNEFISKTYIVFIKVIAGLVFVLLGGHWVVDNAVKIANMLGISEAFIGVSILAAGSSFPEIVTFIIASLKKESKLAIGNIIGSNIFNTFLIIGIASIIKPLEISREQNFNMVINILISTLLVIFVHTGKKGNISKIQGLIFLLLYIAFILISYFCNTSEFMDFFL